MDKITLAEKNRALARQWHPTRNAGLTPRDVTYGSEKRVWWLCKKGHEWAAVVSNRSSGAGCPYCAGRKACKDNCLATVRPLLAQQWHPKKNAPLTPGEVTPGCRKMVWWRCSAGHEWRDSIMHRNAGRGCPYCSRRRVSRQYSLLTTSPDVARQWHAKKNKPLTPATVMAGSGRRVWWRCSKGHEWQARISHRADGAGCPYCSGRRATKEKCLSASYPELARQWHPTRNSQLTPGETAPTAHIKVWWQCKQGHEWQALVSNRSLGRGCPYCAGKRPTKENCLETVRPLLAREWHPSLNGPLTPRDVKATSQREVWWRCRKGHEWREVIRYRVEKGRGCPGCVVRAKG